MKRDISLLIVGTVVSSLISVFSNDIRLMHISPRFTTDIFLTYASVFCLLTGFFFGIKGYLRLRFIEIKKEQSELMRKNSEVQRAIDEVKFKLSDIEHKLEIVKTQHRNVFDAVKREFDESPKGYNTILGDVITEFRDKDKEIIQQSGELHAQLRNKILALKKFADEEFIDFQNHSSAQWHSLEQRLKAIAEQISYPLAKYQEDPNTSKLVSDVERAHERRIIEYNKSFKDWTDVEFGKGHLSYKYKNRDAF